MKRPTNPAASTLLVILGASEFPESDYTPSEAFEAVADAIATYFLSSTGFGLNPENYIYLFNDPSDPTTLLQKIESFITNRTTELHEEGVVPTDLIIFYVGHGDFDESDHYYLALRYTKRVHNGTSSLQTRAIASTLSRVARHMRTIIILDACYSAEAVSHFQSGPVAAVKANFQNVPLPTRGVSLLVSSSKNKVSMINKARSSTMFSEPLLAVLKNGSRQFQNDYLSLKDIHQLTTNKARELYEDEVVHPEIHSPKQTEGDIADVKLFPNWMVLLSHEAQKAAELRVEEEKITQLRILQAEKTKAEEEFKRKANEEAERKRQTKEASLKAEAIEEVERLKRIKEDGQKLHSKEAEQAWNRALDYSLIDIWINEKIESLVVKRLKWFEDNSSILQRKDSIDQTIKNIEKAINYKFPRGQDVKTERDELYELKRERRSLNAKYTPIALEKYYTIEIPLSVYENTRLGEFRNQLVNDLNLALRSATPISFVSVVEKHISELVKKEQIRQSKNNKNETWARWMAAMFGSLGAAVSFYNFFYYINWVLSITKTEITYSATSFDKFNSCLSTLGALLGVAAVIFVLSSEISDYKRAKFKKRSVLTIIVESSLGLLLSVGNIRLGLWTMSIFDSGIVNPLHWWDIGFLGTSALFIIFSGFLLLYLLFMILLSEK